MQQHLPQHQQQMLPHQQLPQLRLSNSVKSM
jgi:hypothetical protein